MKRFYPLLVFLSLLFLLLWVLGRGKRGRNTIEENIVIEQPVDTMEKEKTDSIPGNYRAWVTLTPAEGKRLIARGLLAYEPVAEQLREGDLLVCKGTTNHYIAEALFNGDLTPGSFTAGRIAPANSPYNTISEDQISELYFHNGNYTSISFEDALESLPRGSIILKGANIINYSTKKAAILVADPSDGTLGKIRPYIGERASRLIIPVGLEKNSSVDIDARADAMRNPGQGLPRLLTLPGELFTEIEAIKQFANVEVLQIASGGVGGAEGAVSLMIRGTEDDVLQAMRIIRTIQGEPLFFDKDSV